MLSSQDNELLTRVGPGTPMGEMMRRYWMPALMSRELVADGAPVRLMLLGEKLVAFRDSKGRVGVLDHECPHRCASLFFGRNEAAGLRCIYHGWKFDVDGNCLDMANLPSHQDFKHRIRAKAYRTIERNGIVWTYMGAGQAPRLPDLPVNFLPEDEVAFSVYLRECNWLQGLEGDIDTSHAGFLHFGAVKPEDYGDGDQRRVWTENRSPEYQVTETDWGAMYGAAQPSGKPNEVYWRIAQFVFPFWTITPSSPFNERIGMKAWVPLDDHHTMHFSVRKRVNGSAKVDGMPDPDTDFLPNTTDWYGRWRLKANASNDYGMDRELQRTGNYSGIRGISQEDQAVTESMGPIQDRSKEHLAPSDRMIMVTRRLLLDAVRRLRDEGVAPPVSNDPSQFTQVAGGYFATAKGKDLKKAYDDQLQEFHKANFEVLKLAKSA